MRNLASQDWKVKATTPVDYIMETFDFEKVQRAMAAMGYTWYMGGVFKTPTVDDARECARDLLQRLLEKTDDTWGISTGGFAAEKEYGALKLRFTPEQATCALDYHGDDSKRSEV